MNNKNIQNYIMKTKIIPFDIELAKKIQAREIEGRIVTKNGGEARILAFDSKSYFVDSKIECYTTKDKGINKPLVIEYLDINGDSPIYQVVNLLSNGKLVTCGDSDCDLIIELPEETPKQLNGLAGCDGQCHSCTNDCTLRKYDICTHDFKIGDKVSIGDYNGEDAEIYKIVKIRENLAFLNDGSTIPLDGLVLIESKHEFKPFDKVLVRDYEDDVWTANLYSHTMYDSAYPYGVFCGCYYKQCIPYEGNEHLVGTTDEPK